jgi:twitching motility protein PilU
MFLDPLFKLMAEKQASDLFFTAGAPIQIKINGVVMPINAQVLDPDAVMKIAYEVMSEDQIREYEKNLEMNFAVGRPELGSFRLNVFRQRGAVAMVIRFIKPNIPTIEDLKLPLVLKELVMEKLGMVLIVGSTGSGKSSSMAAMIDHRNATRTGHILTIEDPMEFVYKHKKSIVNQREVGHGHEVLRQCADQRDARSAGPAHDRRDPRQADAAKRAPVRANGPPVPVDPAREQQLPRDEPHHQFLPA